MFIETIPNRTSPPAILLRESYREGKKVSKRTLANLSKLPRELIEAIGGLVKGGIVVGREGDGGLQVERSLPHGHVAAIMGTLRRHAIDRLLLSTAKDAASLRYRDLVVAMITDRLVQVRSKLGFARAVGGETACTSIGEVLGLGAVADREPYLALDWLLERQPRIEAGLARRHLKDGMLVLYDVSSSYLEGHKCPLARFGYSRDHRGDRPQIVYGLLCTRDGLPIAVEVFAGNTADPATLASQVNTLKGRFKLDRVVLVGDRGMITSARIEQDLKPAGLDWISCLRAPMIQELADDEGPLQLSLFDERDMAEIEALEQYPGERLIVCRNPLLADERARKRDALLAATERELSLIKARIGRPRAGLRRAGDIGLAVGAVLNKRKMAKHVTLNIRDGHLSWTRNAESIAREAQLDGLYVIRTSVPLQELGTGEAVQAYKELSRVERAFRSLKTVNLDIRPIRHWTARRVRAHVFLCMLAYHVEWHMRQALAPLLFHDTDLKATRDARASPVAPTEPSATAALKTASKRNVDNEPVMAFADLIAHLGTLARNTVRSVLHGRHTFILYTRPTPLQQKAFGLLGIDPARVQ
jgi:transposase